MRARIITICLSLFVFGALLLPQVALAETTPPAIDPDLLTTVSEGESGIFAGVTTACWKKGTCSLCDILVVGINVSNSILRLLAILATIFFVYGAGLMMLSQGNEDYVSRGKATMKATIVGVIITICAWQIMSIVVFVLANAQAEGGTGKLAAFEGTEEARRPTTGTYNPITSWFTIAEVCNQGKQPATPAPAPSEKK